MQSLVLFAMAIPEKYGDLALGVIEMAIEFEEISKGGMGIEGIMGSHSLSCAMFPDRGTKEQKDRLFPELISGERRTAIVLIEPNAGFELQRIVTKETRGVKHLPSRCTRHVYTAAMDSSPSLKRNGSMAMLC